MHGDRMEECELCGKKTDSIYIIDVDGVELGVCASCAKGKKIVRSQSTAPQSVPNRKRSTETRPEEQELVDDYGEKIKSAREKLGLSLPVLAEMLNEKEPHLLRIEQQKTLPPPELVKKLEKFLGIKLTAEVQGSASVPSKSREEKASIGDFVKKD
jgi:putative transcription factor